MFVYCNVQIEQQQKIHKFNSNLVFEPFKNFIQNYGCHKTIYSFPLGVNRSNDHTRILSNVCFAIRFFFLQFCIYLTRAMQRGNQKKKKKKEEEEEEEKTMKFYAKFINLIVIKKSPSNANKDNSTSKNKKQR